MVTVFHSRHRYRIVVNSNDHPPPHVHAYGKGREARFRFFCPDGPVELWDHAGGWTLVELNALGQEVADHIEGCCDSWSKIHG